MSRDLHPAALDELVALIDGGITDPEDPGYVQTSLDPTDLNLPGVWVVLDTFGGGTLAAGEYSCRVFVIAPSVTPSQALGILAPIFNTVVGRLDAGQIARQPATTELVVIPGTEGQQLPAIAIPVTFTYTE